MNAGFFRREIGRFDHCFGVGAMVLWVVGSFPFFFFSGGGCGEGGRQASLEGWV